MAYKVTLETPEGTQEIECADDTYVLDAAEVRLVDHAKNADARIERARSNARVIASDRTRASRSRSPARIFSFSTVGERVRNPASAKWTTVAKTRRSSPPTTDDRPPLTSTARSRIARNQQEADASTSPTRTPRGSEKRVLRGQGHRGYHRPVRPVLPRRRPDGRRLHPHLRRLPHLRLHHQDPHGTSKQSAKNENPTQKRDFILSDDCGSFFQSTAVSPRVFAERPLTSRRLFPTAHR